MKSFSSDREPLLSPGVHLFLAAISVAGLILVFPGRRFVEQLAEAEHPDDLSLNYLAETARRAPDDTSAQLAYAKQLHRAGRHDETTNVLSTVDNGPDDEQARVQMLRFRAKHATAALPNTAERFAMLARDPWTSPEDLEWLAATALEGGYAGTAAKIFERLAARDVSRRALHLERASRWYRAAGRGGDAARVFETLAYEASDAGTFARYAERAIGALREADRGDEALARARSYLDDCPLETTLLATVATLATAENEPELARDLGRRLLELSSTSPDLLRDQVQRELALADLEGAAEYARQLMEREPDDVEARWAHTEILVWAGRSHEALDGLVALAKTGDELALAQGLEIAAQLKAAPQQMRLLLIAAQRAPLTIDQTLALASACEAVGAPELAEPHVFDLVQRHPKEPVAWRVLAKLRAQRGDHEGALTVRTLSLEHFRSEEEILTTAELLSSVGDDLGAIDLLARVRPTMGNATRFWFALARLAWQEERDDLALEAYGQLWNSDARTSTVALRLLHLARYDAEWSAKMGTIANSAWREFGDPVFMVWAMETAVRDELWGRSLSLLEEAESIRALFHSEVRYWVVRARILAHVEKIPGAIESYERAIDIERSIALQIDFLWLLLDNDETPTLEKYLTTWQADGFRRPELWRAFAIGLHRLGRLDQALWFFEKSARQTPDDTLWWLQLAQVLDEAERRDSAARIRRYVITEHMPRAIAQLRDSKARLGGSLEGSLEGQLGEPFDDPAIAIAFAALGHAAEGADGSERWTRYLADHAADLPKVAHALIGHYLSTGDHDRARAWMEKSEPYDALPRWQRLAMALKDSDLDGVEHALDPSVESRLDAIGRVDEIEALRRLGRNGEALSVAAERLWEKSTEVDPANASLLRQAVSLSQSRPFASRAHAASRELGSVTLREARAVAVRSGERWTLETRVARIEPSADGDELRLGAKNDELDLDLTGVFFARRTTAAATLGVNDDQEDVVPSLKVDVEHRWRPGLSTALDVSLHRISSESDVLRVAGAKDEARLGVSIALTGRDYLSSSARWSRFHDRGRDPLGEGYAFDAEVGRRWIIGEQDFSVRAFAAHTKHRLRRTLPDGIAAVLPAGSSPKRALAAESSLVGLGTTLKHGDPGHWVRSERSLQYRIDAWVGRRFPDPQNAFAVRASVGVAIFGRDELSVGFEHGDSSAGSSGQTSQSFSVQYIYRFGR